MTARFASKSEIDNWNSLVIANPDGGNIFSSYEFAIQKETGGYKARFVIVKNIAIMILEEKVLLLGKFWYIPKGPGVTTTTDLFDLLRLLEPFAKKHGVFAIRLESELPRSQQSILSDYGLYKSKPIMPNNSTITLDVTDTLATILTNLPQKGRYAIKRAERDGVSAKIVPATKQNCRIMFDLLAETAEGQFGIRSFDYYRTFWQRFEASNCGQLFFAYYQGQVVAGAYAMVYGKKSTYKDGASIRKRTAYGASHLLQWEVIKWAKSKGAKIHDFCGSPPSDEIANTNHIHYGIGLFKTSFSKNILDYIGCYDLAIKSFRYKIWIKFGERLSHRWHFYRHDGYY
ncbi:MAG: peptidoglycan bridge formation glycyltransferase FemA/FemB family protein [Candidatus Saccharibacteria bacterium]